MFNKRLLILCIPFLFITNPIQAKPNQYETVIIRAQIVKSFQNLMEMWNEELYFDMYELGQQNSKKTLSLGEFAQRMVDLQWKLSLKPPDVNRIDIVYRNFAVIYTTVEYQHKVNSERKLVKEAVFPSILEGDVWKFDLGYLIRVPYVGKLWEKKEKKKEESQKAVKEEQNIENAQPEGQQQDGQQVNQQQQPNQNENQNP